MKERGRRRERGREGEGGREGGREKEGEREGHTFLFEFEEELIRFVPPPGLLDLAGKAVVFPLSQLLQ